MLEVLNMGGITALQKYKIPLLVQKSFYSYQRRAPLKNIERTYYTLAKGCLMDCSLRVEKAWRDSMNDIYIETFWLIGKQMEI